MQKISEKASCVQEDLKMLTAVVIYKVYSAIVFVGGWGSSMYQY